MKLPDLLVKIVVVLCFSLLIAGFVAYRSGVFDAAGMAEPGGIIAENNSLPVYPDTTRPPVADSAVRKARMMSSSKSMILTDEILWLDTLPSTKRKRRATKTIMPSSKSALVPDYNYILTDSGLKKGNRNAIDAGFLVDSARSRKPENLPATLPGSKSGPMIRPRSK